MCQNGSYCLITMPISYLTVPADPKTMKFSSIASLEVIHKVCFKISDQFLILLQHEDTVKPEIFTTFLFSRLSRLSRIIKIREIKKSEKFYLFSYLTAKFGVFRAIMGANITTIMTCIAIL